MPRVRLLGGLAKAIGEPRLTLGGTRVDDLIQALARRGGERVACLLYGDQLNGASGMSRDLRVLVNGRDIEFLKGAETEVREEDTVTLYLYGGRGYPGG